MHPAQTLDLKADLMIQSANADWRRTATYQTGLDLLDLWDDGTGNLPQHVRESTRRMIDSLHNDVRDAHCYYVAPQMTDLVTWAAAGLDATDAFRFDEVPTERGFAYFENPIHVTGVRGKTILINVVVWVRIDVVRNAGGNLNPGYALLMFNDQVSTPDDVARELFADPNYSTAKYGRWGFTGIQTIMDTQQIGPSVMSLDENSEKVEELLAEGVQPHEFTNILRVMHAYWMMLNQTVTSVSDAEIPRAFSRRARRMEIPDRVTIIALRRISGSSHGESDVDWQYRWIVRGHWRWQHVSKDHELAEPDGEGGWRARVWVRAHVKGPEDKPLHVTEKVYSLVR